MRKANKDLFYKIFNLGVEIEGEFIRELPYYVRYWELKNDASLSSMNDGYLKELITPILRSASNENDCIESLKTLQADGKLCYTNSSCGTHLHFSLKNAGHNNRLYNIFSGTDFYKFFFKRYYKTFTLQKFFRRFDNSYSQRYEIEELSDIYSKSRYQWLNYQSLLDGKGLEIRLFPYITTIQGLQDIIDFMQNTLLDYYNLVKDGEVKEKTRALNYFYNWINKNLADVKNQSGTIYLKINTSSLNDFMLLNVRSIFKNCRLEGSLEDFYKKDEIYIRLLSRHQDTKFKKYFILTSIDNLHLLYKLIRTKKAEIILQPPINQS